MTRLLSLSIALCLLALPAHAGPVASFIAGVFGAGFTGASVGAYLAGVGFAGTLAGSIILNLAGSLLLSRLALALAPKPRQPGIRTDSTAGGSQNPANLIFGRYATDGVLVAPPMSHGENNKFLTLVIELSSVPGVALSRVMIGEEWVELGDTPDANGYGLPVLGKFDGKAWVIFHDGSQTEADPMLLEKYADYPDRPWTAAMVGQGLAYAIVTLKYDRKLFNSIPRLRFEMDGIPLYDPRKDSTVGGAGAQRWDNPATWAPSSNPMVIVYNIHRGIDLGGGHRWGFGNAAEDLPLDTVFAAMNACDALVSDGAGGTEKTFEAGYEAFSADEPAKVCEEILTGCMGQAVEVGGQWRFRVGAPGAPIAALADDQIFVSRGQTLQPFKPLAETYNAITAAHPWPEALYQPVDAPPIYNAAWEAEDGGRRLVADLPLPTVLNPRQAQRLMLAFITEERRGRRHGLTLPPAFFALEPFDVLAWTSTENGYASKLFEIEQVAVSLREPAIQIAIAERDPGDYTPPASYDLPAPVTPSVVVQPAVLSGFAVTPQTIADDGGTGRRPALRLAWDAAAALGLAGVAWEIRLASSGAAVADGTHQTPESGGLTVLGLMPATAFEVRARGISDRGGDWTAWLTVTTPDVRLTGADLSDAVQAALADAVAARGEAEALVDAALIEAQGYADQALADAGALVDDLRAQTTADLAAEIPRLIGAEAAIDGLATQVAWLAARGADQDRQLSEAGLFIDPATGRARLEAVTRIDGQITEASVRLDAIEGALTLKVTQADVDLAIAAAVLDPSQIPAFTGLEGRITDLEVSLDAAEAAITQRATQVDFDALAVDVTTAETRIDALEAEIVQRVETASFDLLETRVSTAEVTLAALDGAGLTIQISDLRARVDGAEGLADATLAALVEGHEEAVARLADAAVIRQEYHALVDDERVARASLRTELGAAIDANTAQIVQEVAARASADAALATEISSLTATVSGNAAAITAEATARADQDAALAGQITTVSAVANGRNRVFRQATAPTAEATGDLWFDSDDGNRPYRWSGTAWEPVADDRIAANAAAITSEVAARATADGALAARLDSVEATSGANTAAITAEQVARADADAALSTQISTVSAVANGRNRTFRQGTAPAGPVAGDIWIDTAAGNLMKRWSGSAWVAVDDTRIAGTAAAVTSEATARASADTALGARIDTVEAAAADNAAAITAEAVARADEDGALAGRIDSVEATAAANTAAITAEATARADQDGVLASQITTVSAAASRVRTFYQGTAPASPQIGDIWFDTSANNRARRYGAGGIWVDTSDTRIAANAAAITTESTARATADGALADQISTVSARADGLEASVSTQATALADVQGNLAASLTLRARAGGAEGEIEVVAADDPTGAPLSSVVIRSDRFRFEGDLAEFLGTVRITSAVIDDLTVQRSNIAPGIVTSFDYIQNPVDWNGGSAQAENGIDALIGAQDVTFSSDANACPEKIVARPRLSGLAPYVNTGNGTLAIYFRIVVKRTRDGVVTTLRDYIEPFWQFVKASGAITQLYYAGRPPSAVVTITQPSFLPGDTLTFEYYYNRTLAGAIGGSVALTSYDLELEEYYR